MSKHTKFTNKGIEALCVSSRTEMTDTQCPGLRLRVGPSGAKTFLFKGRDKFGQLKTVTLGRYPDLSLKDAREKADASRRKLLNGEDPNATKRSYKVDKESPTLKSIIEEYRLVREGKRKIWTRKSPTSRCDAERTIACVFSQYLDQPVISITADALAYAMRNYKPVGRHSNKTANGQVSRARLYLTPVFDWAACRESYGKKGQGRNPRLDLPDVRETYDPASDDETILGSRDRTLTQIELQKVLPLLTWPAPSNLAVRAAQDDDFRWVAMRWILMTLSRKEEVEEMDWSQVNFSSLTWTKSVKTVGCRDRYVTMRLPEQYFDFLRSLPTYSDVIQKGRVFPNSEGGKLGNWNRTLRAIHAATDTSDWHLHDLRRTGSTILLALGVSPAVVDELLSHTRPGKEETSAALEHYRGLLSMHLAEDDAQRQALEKLQAVLDRFEYSVG